MTPKEVVKDRVVGASAVHSVGPDLRVALHDRRELEERRERGGPRSDDDGERGLTSLAHLSTRLQGISHSLGSEVIANG